MTDDSQSYHIPQSTDVPVYEHTQNTPGDHYSGKENFTNDTEAQTNNWTLADAEIMSGMTGSNILDSYPHDQQRWHEALAQNQGNLASIDPTPEAQSYLNTPETQSYTNNQAPENYAYQPEQNWLKTDLEQAGADIERRHREQDFNESSPTQEAIRQNNLELNQAITVTSETVLKWRGVYSTDEGTINGVKVT